MLFFFLLRKKENKVANGLLALTMLVFAFDLFLESLAVTEYLKNYPKLVGVLQTLALIYGPAIYLYVVFISQGIKNFNPIYLLHFLPYILVQIYCLFFFYFESPEYQLNWLYVKSEFPWHLKLVSGLNPIYGGFYLLLTVYVAYKFNKRLKNNFSSIDKHNLSWIKFLSVGAVLMWVVAITLTLLNIFYDENINSELTSYLAMSVFIYTIAYKALRQPEVIVTTEELIEDENSSAKSYSKSGLNEEEANTHLKKLLFIMENDKPYTNDKISLLDLANMVGISSHNLSEIINTKIEQNFYDFINTYRVEEVKKLIKKDIDQTYSILAHGFEAGFTSKSAFYSSFKKITGKTPAQFRREVL